MANRPKNMAACGCGMIGESLRLSGNSRRSRRRIDAANSNESHESDHWWCKDCQRAEWRCDITGKGRMCDVPD